MGGDWKTMDGAPLTRPILVINQRQEPAVVRWRSSSEGTTNPIVSALAGNFGYWQLTGCAFGFDPVAWQELPEAP